MQVKNWLFTETFVNFYAVACLELGRTIRFLSSADPECAHCPKGCLCPDGNDDITVFLDPRWTSRQAQQYATRAILHHLVALDGFPAVRLRTVFRGRELARRLCHRLNWRILGLVVNQKMDRFFPNETQDLLLTDLFVNTVKYINVCPEHALEPLELSLPALDIFYQYFSLRPRQQRQLAGAVRQKWVRVHRLVEQMVRLSENFSVMDPVECGMMLREMIALLGAPDTVEVYYREEDAPLRPYAGKRAAARQACPPAP